MTGNSGEQALDGLWRFEAQHPDWTEDEGGEDGWEPSVAWWAIATPVGLVLVDPLVTDWNALDGLVNAHGGCAGIVRTCHWHQRSITEAARRYGAEVWAKRPPTQDDRWHPFDHGVASGQEAVGGLVAFDVERADELALWVPAHAALIFGDAMLRRADGEPHRCPDSWTQPEGGITRLREVLGSLAQLPVRHVLVSHGPLVLSDAAVALRAAVN
ncbi:MAG: hypothetical protein WBQ18_17085 [Solirubrobacteraceae bacterium]